MMATATQFKVNGYNSATTVTTYTASASISFDDDFRAEIFDIEYIIDYVDFRAKWTGDFRKNNAYVQISYCTILANGKKGQKHNTREMSIDDLALYTNLPADMRTALEAQLGAEVLKAAA